MSIMFGYFLYITKKKRKFNLQNFSLVFLYRNETIVENYRIAEISESYRQIESPLLQRFTQGPLKKDLSIKILSGPSF